MERPLHERRGAGSNQQAAGAAGNIRRPGDLPYGLHTCHRRAGGLYQDNVRVYRYSDAGRAGSRRLHAGPVCVEAGERQAAARADTGKRQAGALELGKLTFPRSILRRGMVFAGLAWEISIWRME